MLDSHALLNHVIVHLLHRYFCMAYYRHVACLHHSAPCSRFTPCRVQVKAGSIFDNIIVADSFAEAEAFAQATWGKTKDAEKAAHDKIQEEEKAAKEAADAAAAAEKPETGDAESADADVDDDYEEAKHTAAGSDAEKVEKDEL